jgi:hypothetical protein
MSLLLYAVVGNHMKQHAMARLRKACVAGNDRACDTLERVCEDGREDACHYVP